MEVPIAGSLRPSPDVAETLRKSHRVSGLVGAVVGALHPPYGGIGSQDWLRGGTSCWAAAYPRRSAVGSPNPTLSAISLNN
jgi:hypothetical protein